MPNAFESGARKNIPAVLVYVRSGNDVLMLHREGTHRENDYHAGKWNGLGGKCEADESALEAARRETREECGLDLPPSAFRSLGVIQFPNFKAHKCEDWTVFVFTADLPVEERPQVKAGAEGSLHWIPADQLLTLNLWPGDQYFLNHVIRGRPFIGAIWYQDSQVDRHLIQPLIESG